MLGLVNLLGTCGTLDSALEVGSFRGVSTEARLLFAHQVSAVDPWDGLDAVLLGFRERLRGYPHLEVSHGRSVEVTEDLPDASFDLVYVDGAHDLTSVRADLAAWRSKIKPGKWIAGHDYAQVFERGAVIRAVDEAFGAPDRVFEDSRLARAAHLVGRARTLRGAARATHCVWDPPGEPRLHRHLGG